MRRLPDLDFEDHGKLFLARTVGGRGRAWLDEHCPRGDDHNYWGDALVVQPRYASDLAEVAAGDGLEVS